LAHCGAGLAKVIGRRPTRSLAAFR